MNTVAIIISLIALVGAGFAFLRASSSHRILGKRLEKLKENNTYLEERLRRLEGGSGRGKKPADEFGETGRSESGRRNQPRPERGEQQDQRNEERQKQRDKKKERQPQERQQQEKPLQEGQPQERQQERRQRGDRQPQDRQQQERQPQQERGQQQERKPKQERQPQDPQQEGLQQDGSQPNQPRRRRENSRRNEPRETSNLNEREQELSISVSPINLEVAGGDLLAELEQQATGNTMAAAAPMAEQMESGKKYAIIPEDGVIRQHQLQQQPDSDSYIEVDAPTEGGNRTHYRFNLAGNHAFVISQGIDRLENAFSFEKPSNRMVSQVVRQSDGVLARVGNGWKIEEKARIDFR